MNFPVSTLPVQRRGIQRPDAKLPQMPPVLQQLVNAGGAVRRLAEAAIRRSKLTRNAEEVEACMKICASCDQWNSEKKRCAKCGCFSQFKARLSTERCPLNKWPTVDIEAR